jgi:hypothetical protein
MTVTKETVPLQGILKGEGRERACRVKAVRRATYADEGMRPCCVSYSRCDIADTDDFPDGEYQLTFEKCQVRFIKRAGQYIPQC